MPNNNRAKAIQAQETRVKAAEKRYENLQQKAADFKPPELRLTYPSYRYKLSALVRGSMTESEIRKEYSRLRSVANKRLERMRDAGFDYTQAYTMHGGRFPKISELNNVSNELSEVVKFLSAKRSSVKFLQLEKERTVAGFKLENENRRLMNTMAGSEIYKEVNIDFSNNDSYRDFLDFLNTVAKSMQDRAWYDAAVNLYGQLQKRSIDWHDILNDYGIGEDAEASDIVSAFNIWVGSADEIGVDRIEQIAKAATGKRVRKPKNTKDYRKLLEKYGAGFYD